MADLVKSDSGKSRNVTKIRKSVRKVIWDKSVFETLVFHVGSKKMEASIDMFRASLKQSAQKLRAESADDRRIRYDMHDLASISGFLGFNNLFEACKRFLSGENTHSISKSDVMPEIRVALREVNRYLTAASKLNRSSVD